MRLSIDHRTKALALLLATTACTVAEPPDGELVTMLHYVQTGRAQVDHYLERSSADALRRAIAQARRSCVRLHSEPGGDGRSELAGSGVLLADGRILTAGRIVPEAGGTTTVTFADGSARRARLLAREQDDEEARDWALLAVDRAPVPAAPTAFGRPRRGRLVAILGFPQGVGVDTDGHVARDAADRRTLAPLATLARVVGRDPLLLAPVAGTLPVFGARGSAVIDAGGRLLGVVVTAQPISRTWLVQRADRVAALAPEARPR